MTTRLEQALRAEFGEIKIGVASGGPSRERTAQYGVDYPRLLEPQAFVPQLFDYQRDLVRQIIEHLGTPGRFLVSLPTGGGKTRTAMMSALEAVNSGAAARVLWLAPTMELLAQAELTLEHLWLRYRSIPDIEIHRSFDTLGRVRKEHAFLLTTPQSVYSRRRDSKAVAGWDLVVFDEAHQLGARTFRSAIEALEQDSPKLLLLGLSATPGRVDEKETEELVRWFGGDMLTSKRLAPNPIEILQRRGVLARLEFEVIDHGVWSKEPQERAAARCARLLFELGSQGIRALYFGGSVEEAELIADALVTAGVAARAVSSKTPDENRERWLQQFADGTVNIITNHRLLATGYDCPAVSHVVLGAKVSSVIQFEQMVGRGARGPRTGGSRKAKIHQVHDHLALHGLPTSYYRFSAFDWSAR